MRNGAADLDTRGWGTGAPSRVLPPEPTYADVSERRFADALRAQLPDDAVMFSDQRFTDRHGDRAADLIVLWPGHGIVVIEVQGGLTHLIDGQWRQPWSSDPRGWRPIDPVEQASKCKYALRDYLFQHPRWSRGNPRLLHMLALPATQLDIDFQALDCPRWLVMDRTDTPDAAKRIVTALRQLGLQPAPPTHDDVRLIIECIAGAAVPQRELLGRLREREDAFELLSSEQAHVLDLAASHTRVEIRGGAGSGKTWLAVEKARRLAMAGKRVALLCHSPGVADYLGRRVATFARGQRPAYVGTFPALGADWGLPPGADGSVDDSADWDREFPQSMASAARRRPFYERFDAIVIDEAQDFAGSWWLAALACLRDPDDGELYVFSDDNQRVLAQHPRPPVPLTVLDLTENLRNTREVAGTFSSLAPTLMRARGKHGVPVGFIQCTPEQALDKADEAIESLQQAGWPDKILAVLTTKPHQSPQVEHVPEVQEGYWRSFWEDEHPFYGNVLGFKGLERPAVVLAINGFDDENRAREILYLGLSRARDLLVICGDIAMIQRIAGDAVAKLLTSLAPTWRAAEATPRDL